MSGAALAQALAISSANFPNGTVGVAYTGTITATGGSPPYYFTVAGQAPGLTVNTFTGVLSGIPTTAGSYVATYTVTDTANAMVTHQYGYTIAPAPVTPSAQTSREQWLGWCTNQNSWTRSTGCTYAVYQSGSNNLALIYNQAGTIIPNPGTAAATSGLISFYADNGRYDIRVSGGDPTLSPAYTISDQSLFDLFGTVEGMMLDNPVITGTVSGSAQFNLQAPVLNSPIINGNVGGAGTFTGITLTNPIINGNVGGTGVFNGQTFASPIITGTVTGSAVISGLTINGGTMTGNINANAANFSNPTLLSPVINGNVGGVGAYTISQLNSTEYVGGNISVWAGVDIGAQINSAYAALPSTGGIIYVIAQPNGGCYNFSTPIVLNVANKAVKIIGLGPSNQTSQGACLNFVPVTALSAITVDYMGTSGSGYAMQHGFDGITLTNNNCTTNGGCGSLATGIQIGTSVNGGNFGMLLGEIKNTKVSGFGTGVNILAIGSWGVQFLNSSLVWNTTGLIGSGQELIKFMGGTIAVNGTGVSGPFELGMNNTSIDSNTIVGITNSSMSGMSLTTVDCHWENLGVPNTHYISGNVNGTVFGGGALDDNATGTADYLFSSTGLALDFDGVIIGSGGQTITQIFLANTVGAQGFVRFMPSMTSFTTVGGTNVSSITDFSIGIGSTPHRAVIAGGLNIVNGGDTASVCSTGAGAGSTCTSTVTLDFTEPNTNYHASCNGTGAVTGFPFIQAITKGTSSITVTLVNGTASQATVSTYAGLSCTVTGT